jgi:hypothetical protein
MINFGAREGRISCILLPPQLKHRLNGDRLSLKTFILRIGVKKHMLSALTRQFVMGISADITQLNYVRLGLLRPDNPVFDKRNVQV